MQQLRSETRLGQEAAPGEAQGRQQQQQQGLGGIAGEGKGNVEAEGLGMAQGRLLRHSSGHRCARAGAPQEQQQLLADCSRVCAVDARWQAVGSPAQRHAAPAGVPELAHRALGQWPDSC